VAEATAAISPRWAAPGGRLTLDGGPFPPGVDGPPHVSIGGHPAHVLTASAHRLRVIVPHGPSGDADVLVEGSDRVVGTVRVAAPLATGIHQVDSPAFDGLGRLYATQSGGRGVNVPVPLYRIDRQGAREPVAVAIHNPTSIALGPDGAMYISSRFEHAVYRLTPDDRAEMYASELGVPTGVAFGPDGALFVGDRSGSIFRVSPRREVETFATLPASVAAFHLAFGPRGDLYVSAPTLASHDPIYRIAPDRTVDVFRDGFGRPQGLAFDQTGDLYVVDALAGAAGLYRVRADDPVAPAELVLSAPALVGVAIDPHGGLVMASNDVIWRLDVPLQPLART
jgi:sugar lactone lactonase YvrE